MSKLRVHDLAGEFSVPVEDLMQILRQMDVPVRTHLSLLTDDQVARVRLHKEGGDHVVLADLKSRSSKVDLDERVGRISALPDVADVGEQSARPT